MDDNQPISSYDAIALYSLPGSNQFYQIHGQAEKLEKSQIFSTPGFVFAPYDVSEQTIYRINGNPAKCLPHEVLPIDWRSPARRTATTRRDVYKKYFEEGVKAIRSGQLKKIVLSIRQTENTDSFSVSGFLTTLRQSYPEAFVYLFYIPNQEFWIGASPELLLETQYPFQRTVALAGTIKDAPTLRDWPAKEREEHEFVEWFFNEKLEGHSFRKEGPQPVKAGPVYHLKSDYFLNIEGQPFNPFDLHPGPALSGYPVPESMELLRILEPSPRRYYTGFLGPVWKEGQSQFYINLRCLEVLQDQLTLYAGGGLTIDSDLDDEWMEIQHKLSTLRSKFHQGD